MVPPNRVARLDNLKSHKFSWGDLEGLITAREISGRILYRGEGRRPNTIVWAITLNGASLSRDMAQRVVILQLARPTFDADWTDRLRRYIDENRWAIIGDVIARLAAPAPLLPTRSRWGTWEREVLARCLRAAECQALILERQGEVDDDRGDAEIIETFVGNQLNKFGYNADHATVFITNGRIAEWIGRALRQSMPTNRASNLLKSLASPRLRKSKDGARAGKGWTWTGASAPPHASAAHDLEQRIAVQTENQAVIDNGRAAIQRFGPFDLAGMGSAVVD